MKTPRVLPIFCCGIALLLASEPVTALAASTRRKIAAAQEEDQNDSASPVPSSTVSKRTRRNADNANSTIKASTAKSETAEKPTPTLTPEDSAKDNAKSKRNRQTTTADEAANAPTSETPTKSGGPAATSSVEPHDIQDFDAQPEPVRKLIMAALDLTKRNLTYTYGSADPAAGGMDCSGTIYYLLQAQEFEDVPRQANEQYAWVRKQARFYAVLSKKQDNVELTEMRPGDLLFWTGTYNIDRDPPVTHAMLYLGKRKKDGRRLMMGASDGRPYDGQRRNGVSVFDFKMPAARNGDHADATTAAVPDHSPDFAGYGPIPGMSERNDAAARQASVKR